MSTTRRTRSKFYYMTITTTKNTRTKRTTRKTRMSLLLLVLFMFQQQFIVQSQKSVQNFTLKRTGPLEVLLTASRTNATERSNETIPFVAIPSGTPLSAWASESKAELGGIFGRIYEAPGSPREWLMRTSTSPFASCSNGVLDEKETCVDGGGQCVHLGRLCKNQQRCAQDTDCISGTYVVFEHASLSSFTYS